MTVNQWIVFIALIGLDSSLAQVISFGMRKLAYSTNQFGLDLLRAMDNSDTSTAFCPICISSSLVMMLMGSHGHTATALRHALYLWGMQTSEVNVAFHDMMTHLGVNMPNYRRLNVYGPSQEYRFMSPQPSLSDTEAASGNDIAFLSHIYAQRDFAINYNYAVLLQRFYKTAIHPLDFIENGEETRQHINAIVEKETMGKIKDILPDRQSPTTQLLLLSALYFKGSLDLNITVRRSSFSEPVERLGLKRNPSNNPMDSNSLGFGSFADDQVILEARNVRIRHGFDRYLNCTTIEMPFKGGLTTLVAIMPGDPGGLDKLLTRLSGQVLSDVINALEVKRVNVKIPRLNFETSDRNLSASLANLGISYIFKPGYSQLYDISDYKWLFVSDIIHKTHLEIREPPRMFGRNHVKSHYQAPSNIEVSFDKPFLFFIMDNISGLILAMGKYGREPVNYRLPMNFKL